MKKMLKGTINVKCSYIKYSWLNLIKIKTCYIKKKSEHKFSNGNTAT